MITKHISTIINPLALSALLAHILAPSKTKWWSHVMVDDKEVGIRAEDGGIWTGNGKTRRVGQDTQVHSPINTLSGC